MSSFVESGKTSGGFIAAAFVRAVLFKRWFGACDAVRKVSGRIRGPTFVRLAWRIIFIVLVLMHIGSFFFDSS